jgi:hypothetical protein
MKTALLLIFAFSMVAPQHSWADKIAEALSESSKKICTAKYDALAKSDQIKAKKIDASGDKNLIINVCLARSFNASRKCTEDFLAKAAPAVKGLKDPEAIQAEMKKLKPDQEACLRSAHDGAMADSEILFDLYGKGRQAEGKAVVDLWIKDGSAKISN